MITKKQQAEIIQKNAGFYKMNKKNKTGFYKLIVYLAEQNKFENASDVRGMFE